MKLKINDEMPVSTLQTDFNTMFPFLKLEVKSELAKACVHKSTLLKHCRRQHNNGEFEVQQHEALIDFINRLKQEFGLQVEVFRKCGKLWIATTLSNTWTLGRQNNEGLEINSYIKD